MLVDGFQLVQHYVETVEVGIDDSTLDQNWHNTGENCYIDPVSFDLQYLSGQFHLLLFYIKQIQLGPKPKFAVTVKNH